uniref:Uncharacterized protein n=1 Tax=Glossina austeni TaxID=7395 RepID=A0A1A9UWD0_GLOAU
MGYTHILSHKEFVYHNSFPNTRHQIVKGLGIVKRNSSLEAYENFAGTDNRETPRNTSSGNPVEPSGSIQSIELKQQQNAHSHADKLLVACGFYNANAVLAEPRLHLSLTKVRVIL